MITDVIKVLVFFTFYLNNNGALSILMSALMSKARGLFLR